MRKAGTSAKFASGLDKITHLGRPMDPFWIRRHKETKFSQSRNLRKGGPPTCKLGFRVRFRRLVGRRTIFDRGPYLILLKIAVSDQ